MRRGGRASRTKRRSVTGLARRVTRLERSIETKMITWDCNGAIAGAHDSSSLGASGIYIGNAKTLLLNPLTKGDAVQHREGDKVRFIYFKGKVTVNFTRDIHDLTTVNWALVRVKHPNGSLWTAAAFLNAIYGVNNPGQNNIPDELNHQNSWRRDFEFIKVGRITHYPGLEQSDIAYTGGVDKTTNVSTRLNITTGYPRSNNGDYSDIDTNAIYFLAWTTAPQVTWGSSENMKVCLSCNLYFKDG